MDKSKLSDEAWVQLGAWSRDEVTRVGFKYSRIFLPSLNNGLIRRFPSQRFEVLGKVKGTHKGQHMRFQAFQVGAYRARTTCTATSFRRCDGSRQGGS